MPARTSDAKIERAAVFLARGGSREKAAAAAGLSVRTLYNLCQDAEFRARVAALRAEITDEAVGRLSALAGRAAGVLGKLLADPDQTVRLRAAQSVLGSMVKVREHHEFDARLARLESLAQEIARGKP